MGSAWLGDVGEGAAKGAAIGATLGTVVPGIGNAVGGAAGGVIGGVAGLIGNLFPAVGEMLDGPNGAEVAPVVEKIVQDAVGSTEPGVVTAKLAVDPALNADLAARFKAMADLDAAYTERFKAALADVADARKQTVALAESRNPLAWGAAIVSVIVLVAFGGVITLTLLRAIPPGSETVLNVLLGTLAAMATSVVSYWCGSSVGSARKDSILAAERERR